MADLSFLRNLTKPVAVLGLGVSGRAVANALQEAGVEFYAMDDNAKGNEFPLADFTSKLQDYAFLVPSAGIKPSHPVIAEAMEKNIQILSDVDLLLQSAPDATSIAITGTNGKSTTTALIAHILREAGKNVAVGGNLGFAACSLPGLGTDGFYVLEMSSYMLHYSAHAVADIALLLNIAPDHLDWHGTMDHYIAAKESIFRQRTGHKPQVQIRGITMTHQEPSFTVPDHPFLKGAHNRENMIAATEACLAAGLDLETILRGMMTFEGLPHRQKRVAVYKNVEFINDSKGTNPDATAKALDSFDDIYWILGGQATDDLLNGLEIYFPKIRHAYLIGEASDVFASILEGRIPYTKCGILKNAVTESCRDAMQNGAPATVLLSPACKSWDQYKNFEQRGDDFAACVLQLVKEQAA